MDLILARKEKRSDGIFSQLWSTEKAFICETLEHAYRDQEGYFAKLPCGEYQCRRSSHRLHGMDHDFETFEVIGVPGHSGILFHWGNFQKDSEGCILVGALMGNDNGVQMITHSKATFERFMSANHGVDLFTLKVIDG